MARYTPERGDIVWLHLDLGVGHEQAGRRPALVISTRAYNGLTGMALCCPITSHAKGYPFEVEIPEGAKARGVVLCDHIRSVAWRGRRASRLCAAPPGVIEEATAKLSALIDLR